MFQSWYARYGWSQMALFFYIKKELSPVSPCGSKCSISTSAQPIYNNVGTQTHHNLQLKTIKTHKKIEINWVFCSEKKINIARKNLGKTWESCPIFIIPAFGPFLFHFLIFKKGQPFFQGVELTVAKITKRRASDTDSEQQSDSKRNKTVSY